MPSIHDYMIERRANERMRDPEWAHAYADVLGKMMSGYFDQAWQNAFCQTWDRFPPSIYDAAAFAELWTLLQVGKLATATLDIGVAPVADAQDVLMNDLLYAISDMEFHINDEYVIPAGSVSAKFWGGNDGADGEINFNHPITLAWNNTDAGTTGEVSIDGGFPLEIGYQKASKTLLQLKTERRLARWPYGSERIYLIYNTAPLMANIPVYQNGLFGKVHS